MKFAFNFKKQEASIEADVEGLIKPHIESKLNNPNRKTKYQIRQEEKRKNKELEQKQFMQGMLMLLGIIIFCLIICAIGAHFE